MNGHRLLLIVAAALVLASAGAGTHPAEAHYTATSGNLRLLYFSGDAIRNYDFNQQTIGHVDWTVNLLFFNDAEIDRIKNALCDQNQRNWCINGEPIYGRLSDNGGQSYVWDEDSGRKRGDCTLYDHYRIYADSDDHMYTPAMGFYVFGATHRDWYECYPYRYHGFSERVEKHLTADLWGLFTPSPNYANFYNYETYREEGNHIWHSSGRATYAYVPDN